MSFDEQAQKPRFVRRQIVIDAFGRANVAEKLDHARGDFGLERGRVVLRSDRMLTFSGIALYRPEFFSGCSAGRFPLLPLFKRAIAAGALSGEHYAGQWSDVGTPQRLAALEDELAR